MVVEGLGAGELNGAALFEVGLDLAGKGPALAVRGDPDTVLVLGHIDVHPVLHIILNGICV